MAVRKVYKAYVAVHKIYNAYMSSDCFAGKVEKQHIFVMYI